MSVPGEPTLFPIVGGCYETKGSQRADAELKDDDLTDRSFSASTMDVEKQESKLSTAEFEPEDLPNTHIVSDTTLTPDFDVEMDGEKTKSALRPQKGGQGLPPNHPMHPSQFSGDRFELQALMTLAGSFCVMVSLTGLSTSGTKCDLRLIFSPKVHKLRMD